MIGYLAIGISLRVNPPIEPGDIILPPAGPSAAFAEYGPGDSPGEVFVRIVSSPSNYGDGAAFGDNAGTITSYTTWIGAAELDHPPTLPAYQETGGHPEGVAVQVRWQAFGYDGGGSGGRPGQISTAFVYPAITPPVANRGLVDTENHYGLVSRATGHGLVVAPA